MPARSQALDELEKEVVQLRNRVAALEESAPINVPIETLAPEPYELLKPFHAVVQLCDDEYVATFYDANVSASGATQEEAVANLKDMVVAAYETLTEHEPDRLGRAMVKQLRVLKEFMRRKA
jgi:predicted RNase H-like HicB family nuclease